MILARLSKSSVSCNDDFNIFYIDVSGVSNALIDSWLGVIRTRFVVFYANVQNNVLHLRLNLAEHYRFSEVWKYALDMDSQNSVRISKASEDKHREAMKSLFRVRRNVLSSLEKLVDKGKNRAVVKPRGRRIGEYYLFFESPGDCSYYRTVLESISSKYTILHYDILRPGVIWFEINFRPIIEQETAWTNFLDLNQKDLSRWSEINSRMVRRIRKSVGINIIRELRMIVGDNMSSLSLTPITNSHCLGFHWSIPDEDRLAELVAELLLGHHRHIRKILNFESSSSPSRVSCIRAEKIKKILQDVPHINLPHTEQDKRYHRDGWLFQMISWIAIRQHDPTVLTAIPHTQPAAKGFDNLVVEVSDGRLVGVIVGEDKATENPRKTITSKIWPDIDDFEKELLDSDLMAEVTAIIEAGGYGDDADAMIKNVFWQQVRRYRVTVAGPYQDHESLFKGFVDRAPGPIERRRGEVLILDDLRVWFDGFSEKVVAALESRRETDV